MDTAAGEVAAETTGVTNGKMPSTTSDANVNSADKCSCEKVSLSQENVLSPSNINAVATDLNNKLEEVMSQVTKLYAIII